MKKILVFGLSLMVLFTLSACSNEDTLSTIDNPYVDKTEGDDAQTETEALQELNTIMETISENGIDFDDFDYEPSDYTMLSNSDDLIYITAQGSYLLEGEYTSTIIIDVNDDEDVSLVLYNATLSSSTGPAIVVLNAEDVTISVPENTESTLSDSSEYTLVLEEELDAVIYSTSDLEFNGLGVLNIDANYNNAIHSKDDIKISEVTLQITSVDDGIVGKDYVAFQDTVIDIECVGDAIKATNSEEQNKGFIYIASGTFTLETENDGLEAVNSIIIYDGTFTIDTLGNGFETNTNMYLGNGVYNITSQQDAINATSDLIVYSGVYNLTANDDAIHSDNTLTINGGTITITNSYEGIEAYDITINGGTITVNSTDDAINATTGGGQVHGTGYTSLGGYLSITGGIITVNAVTGDGIDVNGTATMSGGYVLVFGTSADNQSALDFDISFTISGGTIITLGSTGMIHSLSETSEQASILYADNETYSEGDIVTLYDSEGTVLFQVEAIRDFTGMVISLEDFQLNSSYTLELDTTVYEFEITSIVTTLGDGGSTMEGMPPVGGRPGR